MISENTFEKIRSEFGHYASWAIWAEEGDTPKSNIDDLSVFQPEANSKLLETIKNDYIFVGLNISRPIERPLGNFHDSRPMATDFKLRYALKNTPYWGGYMTDIIKDFEEKASGKMMRYLKSDPAFERENIQTFKSEITLLGCADPLIITLGKDAEKLARKNFGDEYRICGVPHYANYTSKERYREQVNEVLETFIRDPRN